LILYLIPQKSLKLFGFQWPNIWPVPSLLPMGIAFKALFSPDDTFENWPEAIQTIHGQRSTHSVSQSHPSQTQPGSTWPNWVIYGVAHCSSLGSVGR